MTNAMTSALLALSVSVALIGCTASTDDDTANDDATSTSDEALSGVSLDTSVFTTPVFSDLQWSPYDPSAEPCPYNLVIKAKKSRLDFYTRDHGKTKQTLWFSVAASDISNVRNESQHKYFDYDSGLYGGHAEFDHDSDSNPFYEITIERSDFSTLVQCRYTKF